MEVLKLDNRNTTLVDSVEESLIRFFKEKGLRPGSSIPNEIELALSLIHISVEDRPAQRTHSRRLRP